MLHRYTVMVGLRGQGSGMGMGGEVMHECVWVNWWLVVVVVVVQYVVVTIAGTHAHR